VGSPARLDRRRSRRLTGARPQPVQRRPTNTEGAADVCDGLPRRPHPHRHRHLLPGQRRRAADLPAADPRRLPRRGRPLADQRPFVYLDKFGLSRARRLAKVVEQLLESVGGVLVSFDFSVPAAFDGVLDEGEFQLVALGEARCVVTGGEEFGTGEHEVAFAGTFLWQAKAVSEFELGLEEVGLQPGHGLRVEAVIA